MSAVINSDELSGWMSSVEINDFDFRPLEDTVELTANVCSCVVELKLAVEVAIGFDWLISEAELVCVRMDTAVDVYLSESTVEVDLLYSTLDNNVVSNDDMYMG